MMSMEYKIESIFQVIFHLYIIATIQYTFVKDFFVALIFVLDGHCDTSALPFFIHKWKTLAEYML